MGSAQEFSDQLKQFGNTFSTLAQRRQQYSAAAITIRANGLVSPISEYNAFESARSKLLQAARRIDQQLLDMEKKDYAAFVKVTGILNDAASKIPGMNISSPMTSDLVIAALPSLPIVLYQPRESVAVRDAIAYENSFYGKSSSLNGLGGQGLGALWAAVGAWSVSGCLTAATAAGIATGGAGFALLAVCAVVAIAAVVAVTAIVYLFIDMIRAALNPAQSAADALGDAYSVVRKTCKEQNLSSDECAKLLKDAGDLIKDPPGGGLPWKIIIPVAAGAALWFFWPVIMGKVTAARAKQTQSVAGLPRRRTSRNLRARRA